MMNLFSFYKVLRIFPLYLFIAVISIASYGFAQDELDVESISTLTNDQSESEYIKSQEVEKISESSSEEIFNEYEGLNDSERQDMFGYLDDSSKQDLFNALDDEDRLDILSTLNHDEKSRLINSLSDVELKRWIEKYPDILSEVDIEKTRLGELKLKDLIQFGYDYFEGQPSLAPVKYGPVTSDYILGPDDSFTIHLWGRVEETYPSTVSREGTITLPRIGTMNVSGLTFSELKIYLENRFKEFYPDFEMSINMDTLRTVEVYMMGEFIKPGSYNLNSLSTAISALFASGGPGKNGSLRNIKVLKNGELVNTIDLYNFFINGSKRDDVRLQQGYTVFVPVIGPVAGIAGMVKRPAIYEMKEKQTLEEIIEFAGGILPTGHLQNVIIERVAGHRRRVIESFNLDPSYEKTDVNLKTVIEDGDLIKIFPIYTKMEKVVYLEGNVKYPRKYELKEGMRVKDIIPSFDYLLPESYLPQAEIVRLVPPDLHPEIRIFNLGAMLEGDETQNLLLSDQDRIVIYNAWEKTNLPEVSINGALRNPGIYRLYDGMTIKDLIFKAGNPTESAYLENGELTRLVPSSSGTDIVKISFSPQKAIAGNPEDNLILHSNDQVHIREIPRYADALEKKVFLEGELNFPGEYSFADGERLSSVIERAGSFTNEAYLYGAVFLRESVKRIQTERKNEYIDRLEQDIFTLGAFAADTAVDSSRANISLQALSGKKEMLEKLRMAESTGRMALDISDIMLMPSGDNDIELRPGDRLIIGKRPDSVFIIGEVYNPNAMVYTKYKDVGYYLNLVGGMTDNADKKQIYIVRADGTVVSKKQSKLGLFNWNSEKHRWGFGSFKSLNLLPGDTVIVPKKVAKASWLTLFKDTTSVIYEIAVSAGVLKALFD